MANQYVNKVIIGNEVKIDLTGDDITAEKLAKGIKAHDKSGAPIVGTCPFDTDTSEATATAAEVLNGKTFGAGGEVKTGSMPNQGGKTLEVTEKYHRPGRCRHDERQRGHEAPGEERDARLLLPGGPAGL